MRNKWLRIAAFFCASVFVAILVVTISVFGYITWITRNQVLYKTEMLTIENTIMAYHEKWGHWPRTFDEVRPTTSSEELSTIDGAIVHNHLDLLLQPSDGVLSITYVDRTNPDRREVRYVWKEEDGYHQGYVRP